MTARGVLALLLVLAGAAATGVGAWLAFGLPGVLLLAGPGAVVAGLVMDVDPPDVRGADGKPAR